MRLDFCIWGCGVRGKLIYQFLSGQGVRAFIDMNSELQGRQYQNIPIISIETYLEKYQGCIVIVSPMFGYAEIEQRLSSLDVAYLSSQELPQEIYDGVQGLLDLAVGTMREEETAYFYGLNLFSICLLDYCMEKRICGAKIIPEPAADSKLIKALENQYSNCIGGLDELRESRLYLTSDKYDFRDLPAKNLENLYDFLYWAPEYCNPKIKAFADIHKGKRCFILGTGPSLQIEDLNKLADKGEICISVNGIVRAFKMTAWRPDYYVCQYKYGFERWKDALLDDGNVAHMLISDGCLQDDSATEFMKFHLSLLVVREDRPPAFSRDFSCGAYVGGNVMYTCIQLAAYLGFTEIYLYGVDHSFAYEKRDNHFYADHLMGEGGDAYVTASVVESEAHETEIALAAARRAGEERGFRIYNATRGGKLEIFERVDFDTLLGESKRL